MWKNKACRRNQLHEHIDLYNEEFKHQDQDDPTTSMCKQGGNATVTYCLQAPLLILSILRTDRNPWARLSSTHKGTTLKNCFFLNSMEVFTPSNPYHFYLKLIRIRVNDLCKQATPGYTCTACLRNDLRTQALDIFLGKHSAADFGCQVIIQSLDTLWHWLWHSMILETSWNISKKSLEAAFWCPCPLTFRSIHILLFLKEHWWLLWLLHRIALRQKHPFLPHAWNTRLCAPSNSGGTSLLKMRLQCVPMTCYKYDFHDTQHKNGLYYPRKFLSKIWQLIGKYWKMETCKICNGLA